MKFRQNIWIFMMGRSKHWNELLSIRLESQLAKQSSKIKIKLGAAIFTTGFANFLAFLLLVRPSVSFFSSVKQFFNIQHNFDPPFCGYIFFLAQIFLDQTFLFNPYCSRTHSCYVIRFWCNKKFRDIGMVLLILKIFSLILGSNNGKVNIQMKKFFQKGNLEIKIAIAR